MKQRIGVVTFWAILIAAVAWWAYQKGRTAPVTHPKYSLDTGKHGEREFPGLPNGLGTPDDRFARFTWEHMRLADPATGKVPANIRKKELAFANKIASKKSSATNTPWDKRGPYNVGGRTRAFALDITDENIIVAGGVTGGMWRSTDGGQSYTKTTSPEQLHSVTCVVQDTRPGKENVWYHGTGEYYALVSASYVQASGNGIYKSTDNGQSWELLPATISNTPTTLYDNDFDFVWDLVVDHTDAANDVVFAALINGIYRSKDGGQSWTPVLGGDTTVSNLAQYTFVAITSNGVLYAVISGNLAYSGIWRSDDQGDNWTSIRPGGWPAGANRNAIAIVPQNENSVFFMANAPGSGVTDHTLWKYTYLSGNGSGAGGIWENKTANLPDEPCEVFYDFDFGTFSSQSGYDLCLVVSPADSNLVLLGGTNVYRSEDGWSTPNNYDWIGGYRCDPVTPSDYVYRNHHPDQHKMIFLPSNPNVLLNANDGGLYKTTNILKDSVDWIPLNNGYMNSQFYTVAFEQGNTGSNHLVGGMQDNGTHFTNSMNPNQPWANVFYGDGSYCAIAEGRDNYYLSWQTGKTFKFEIADDGTVLGKTRIDPDSNAQQLFINPFILDPADNNVMYMTTARYIWRNNDLASIPITGNEYQTISTGWERLDESMINLGFGQISSLDMSKADNSILYYGTTAGRLFRLDSLQGNVTQTALSGFPAGAYLASVDVNENDAAKVLITMSNYGVISMYYSDDYGATWTAVSGNLEENPDGSGDGPAVLWAEMLDMGDSVLYFAGTTTGLYSTTQLDGISTQWRQEGAGTIGNVVVNMIQTRSYDGLVAVATHGTGIYSTRYKPWLSAPELVVAEGSLHCSPNPVVNEASINYTLNTTTLVGLYVFSLDGRLVRTLVNETQQPGEQRLIWSGTGNGGATLPAGPYVLQLIAGKEKETLKVLLAR